MYVCFVRIVALLWYFPDKIRKLKHQKFLFLFEKEPNVFEFNLLEKWAGVGINYLDIFFKVE